MPFFTMAKKTPTVTPVPDPSSSSSRRTSTEAAAKRPGTSGTELLLTTNRRTASAQYLAAQRAETAYKAKKRSAGARQHRSEAMSHFKLSASHLRDGMKSCGCMLTAVPWMVREWREKRQDENEKKSVERYMEKKKKMEEKIARQGGREEEKKEQEA